MISSPKAEFQKKISVQQVKNVLLYECFNVCLRIKATPETVNHP